MSSRRRMLATLTVLVVSMTATNALLGWLEPADTPAASVRVAGAQDRSTDAPWPVFLASSPATLLPAALPASAEQPDDTSSTRSRMGVPVRAASGPALP